MLHYSTNNWRGTWMSLLPEAFIFMTSYALGQTRIIWWTSNVLLFHFLLSCLKVVQTNTQISSAFKGWGGSPGCGHPSVIKTELNDVFWLMRDGKKRWIKNFSLSSAEFQGALKNNPVEFLCPEFDSEVALQYLQASRSAALFCNNFEL